MKKLTLDTSFTYKCMTSDFFDINTHTNSESKKEYTFVFNGPYYKSERELFFSQSHGLIDKNTKEEVVSQLLSIYNTFHADSDEKKYTDSLLNIFKKYGPFFDNCNSRVPAIVIDNYLGLISHLCNALTIIGATRPLNKLQCDSLIKDIVFFAFYDCDGLESSGQRIQEMPFHTLQRESYYEYKGYDSDCYFSELLHNEIRKTKTYIHTDEYQPRPFYLAHHVINELFSLVESYDCNAIKEEMDFLSDDTFLTLYFLKECLDFNKIEIKTDKESTLTYVQQINYDFTPESEKIISIAESLVYHFLNATSSRCAPAIRTSFENNTTYKELYFPVNSLFDAILESFLLSDFTNNGYRTCALENCTNQFWTNKKQSKKKYCCRAHARTAATHKFREEQ